MEVINLKQAIIDKTLDNFYIFTGVEAKVARIYIDKISEVSSKPLRFIDKVSDIYGKSNSLFSESYTYVCIGDSDFVKSEHAWETVEGSIGDNILILWLSDIDKRSKFYKQFSDRIIYNFEPLIENTLRKHLKAELKLSDKNLGTLLRLCENDYGKCLLEVDKVKQYKIGYGKDKQEIMPDDGAFLHLVTDGAIDRPIQTVIFDFADAVIRREYRNSWWLLDECMIAEESALKMTVVLYKTFKRVLQVQSCKSDNIAVATGLSDWEIRYGRNNAGKYSIGELVRALRIIRQTEYDFKRGQIDEEYMIPYILVSVL